MEVILPVSVNYSKNRKRVRKKMRQVGNVEVPQSAFLAVLKLD